MANGWKVAFWIVFIIMILETLLIVWAYNIGTNETQNHDACQVRCSNVPNAVSFYYADHTCSCADAQGQELYSEYMK